LTEFQLIELLTSKLKINDNRVIVGFGDDCAGVKLDDTILLFSNDIQVENVHFILDKINPQDLGWKLISVNVSDVVACGGKPQWCNISIGIPNYISIDYLEGIYTGINEALQFYKFNLIGGNTSKSKELILDLFIAGTTDRFVSRFSVEKGDTILLSGYTGLSRAGLELLLMNKEKYEDFELKLIKYHTRPTARLDLVEIINKKANACIDISDGLAGDIAHMLERNKLGALIENLPIHPLLEKFCKKYNKNPIDYILYGGEDYQLVFTVKKDELENLPKNIFKIGKIIGEKGIFYKKNGKIVKLKERGFSHL
jgi:thiamine-monophosphate kinase